MVKFTSDEMGLIAMFEHTIGVAVKDCIINNDITIIVKEGGMGLAIGKKGRNVNKIKKSFGREVHVYEYSNDPNKFLENLFFPIKIKKIEIVDGIVLVSVDLAERRRAIGSGGKKIKSVKEIILRHFDFKDVKVV